MTDNNRTDNNRGAKVLQFPVKQAQSPRAQELRVIVGDYLEIMESNGLYPDQARALAAALVELADISDAVKDG